MRQLLSMAVLLLGLVGVTAAQEDEEEEGGFEVSPTKAFYAIGEDVVLKAASSGGIDLTAGFKVRVYRSGDITNPILTAAVTWSPTSETFWTWNQKDAQSQPVPAAMYAIEVLYRGSGESEESWLIFRISIVPKPGAGEVVIGTTRNEYRLGQEVDVYVLNNSAVDVVLPSPGRIAVMSPAGTPVFERPLSRTPVTVPRNGGRISWHVWDLRVGPYGTPDRPYVQEGVYLVRVNVGTQDSSRYVGTSIQIRK